MLFGGDGSAGYSSATYTYDRASCVLGGWDGTEFLARSWEMAG